MLWEYNNTSLIKSPHFLLTSILMALGGMSWELFLALVPNHLCHSNTAHWKDTLIAKLCLFHVAKKINYPIPLD